MSEANPRLHLRGIALPSEEAVEFWIKDGMLTCEPARGATTVVDGFAPIGWLDAVIPFRSPYRPLWLGLGAVAVDLLIALTVSSLLRGRIGHRAWRAIHWLSYASWPVGVIHGLGTGTDTWSAWMLVLTIACIAAVAISVGYRFMSGPLDPLATERTAFRAAVERRKES